MLAIIKFNVPSGSNIVKPTFGSSPTESGLIKIANGACVITSGGLNVNLQNCNIFGGITIEGTCIYNGGNKSSPSSYSGNDCYINGVNRGDGSVGSGNSGNRNTNSSSTKIDGLGFVITPIVAVEYDSGLLHADINIRYIHALLKVDRITANPGPLALFFGGGLGLAF